MVGLCFDEEYLILVIKNDMINVSIGAYNVMED